MPQDLVEAKALRRRAVRAARRDRLASGRRVDDAQALARHALDAAHRLVPVGGRVAAYESTTTEPPTEAMITALARDGYDVIVPVTLPGRVLDWRHPGRDDERLGPEAVRAAVLVLAPGLSVDRYGTRLGQGGGYYDGVLASLPRSARVLVVLHDEEFVDGPLPRERHDERVHGVLTPAGASWVTTPGSA